MYSCRLLQNVLYCCTVKPQMAVCNDREQPQYMQNNKVTDKKFLDDITIVPNTLSPDTFSAQVLQRLGIRSFMKRTDAVNFNNDFNHRHITGTCIN